MSQSELIKTTKHLGMELIAESINLISQNKVKLISKPDSEMTYYSFPSSNDVKEFLMLENFFK